MPGTIINGRKLRFDCGTSRAIGYFLEFLLCLAPFGKVPLHIYLTGITNHNDDPSVDTIRTVLLPVLKRFGIEEGLELKVSLQRPPRPNIRTLRRNWTPTGLQVLRRGLAPEGGGEVMFQCPVVRQVRPVASWNHVFVASHTLPHHGR